MYNHTVNIQGPQQNFPREAQPQVLYKQSFQCPCSKIFNSLDQYNYHVQNQNHDFLQSKPYGFNHDLGFQLKSAQIQKNNPLIEAQIQHQIANSNPNQQLFSTLNNSNIYDQINFPNSISFDKKSYQYPNNHIQKPILESYPQQFTRQSQIQQKQQSFKYIQAYYAQKMAPYYRQFDIDPEKPFSNKKSTYQNKNYFSISSRNLRIQQNSSKFTRSEATTDLNKILQELGVRMIPVQNGIVDFIHLFTSQNFQKITQLKDTDVQKVQTNLQESVNLFSMICFQNKKNIPKGNLFMDSDIDFIIKTFIEFLKEILRYNQLWVGYMMLIPIIEGILKFCQENKDNLDGNLRLIDFPFILSSIKINNLANIQELPLKVESDKITQFLIWFTQWFTIVQLIKSKWNIDYIEPFYDQIHYINKVYEDNVNKYRKCFIEKQVQYGKRYKRKLIEKQRQKQRFQRIQQRQFRNSQLYRSSFDPMEDFENVNDKQGYKMQRQPYNNDNSIRKENHLDASYNNQVENFQYKKISNNQVDPINKTKLKQNQRNFTQSSEVNDIFNKQLQQKAHQENIRKRNYRDILESQYLNSHINNYDLNQREYSEDDQMKEVYMAAFKSQYVSYFSPEYQQARKKEQQKWLIKVQKLKEIIKDPQLLKTQIFSKVSNQLQEVNQLVNLIRIDLYRNYQQRIMKLSNQNIKQNVSIQKSNNSQPNHLNEQVVQTKKPSIQIDPFIIQRNYRFRNNYALNFNKFQFQPKYPMESSQYEIKNQQEINNKFQTNQKINKFDVSKKSQENQVLKFQQKGKNSLNLQNEIKKGISYVREDSNDFLDDLL